MQTAVQLYTLRHLDEPLPDTIARVGETSFDGVEFAGLGDADPAEITAALDDADLDVMAAHVGLDDLASDLDDTVEAYRNVGCDHFVIPWLGPAAFADREAVAETAQRLSSVGDRVREHGVKFSYHNHTQEFQPVGDRSAFAVLADEAPDVTFELDAGWALAAGHDPADLLRELGERVPTVHCKDVAVSANRDDGGRYATDDHRPVELGEGDLDLAEVADAAADAGVDWACYEHDAPDDPLESLRHGSETLAGLV